MSNYANSLYRDYERLEIKNSNLSKENKFLLLRATIAEYEQRRLENIVIKKNQENNALKELNNNLKTENENNSKTYYADKELTLIKRMMEYRDNYIY